MLNFHSKFHRPGDKTKQLKSLNSAIYNLAQKGWATNLAESQADWLHLAKTTLS